jgi:hypothetical protein
MGRIHEGYLLSHKHKNTHTHTHTEFNDGKLYFSSVVFETKKNLYALTAVMAFVLIKCCVLVSPQ